MRSWCIGRNSYCSFLLLSLRCCLKGKKEKEALYGGNLSVCDPVTVLKLWDEFFKILHCRFSLKAVWKFRFWPYGT